MKLFICIFTNLSVTDLLEKYEPERWKYSMRIIIAGSRNITEYDIVKAAVEDSGFSVGPGDTVLSGCARGVDRIGEEITEIRGAGIERHPADWDAYGKRAGYLRNAEMAKAADALIAVWDGESRGTKNMIELMQRAGKPCYIKKV